MAVTKTNNLRYGMKNNEDVRQLQTLLNNNGANLAVDGNFGAKTLAAVKDYQTKNNLKVDGIVGTNTWGSLNSGASANTQAAAQATTPAATPAVKQTYQYDAANDPVYQQALKQQKEVQASAPVYAGTYDQQVKEMYEQVMNQKPFAYDLNGDALWQQYKDQYTTQGKMAMMDTMGQAAALTGGYGSSYSQAAGQQAYQGYLQQLNDRVPELYQLALDKYNNEQAQLQNQFAMAAQMQADEYGKYQDALGQHNIEVDRARSAADTAYDRGYSAWSTEQQLIREDDNTAYSRQQDKYGKLVDLIASTGYTPTQEELQAAGMSATEAASYGKVYSDAQKAARSSNGTVVNPVAELEIPSVIQKQLDKCKSLEELDAYISSLEQGETISGDLANYIRQIYNVKAVAADTENTRSFRASVMNEREFARRGKKATVDGKTYTDYQSYVEACLEKWTDKGVPNSEKTLTYQEVLFLMDQYGF